MVAAVLTVTFAGGCGKQDAATTTQGTQAKESGAQKQLTGTIEEEKDLAFSKKKIDLAWMDSFKENRNVTELTRELVVTLIDRIEVSADKSIEITFRIKDEFKQLKECVDKLKEEMAG